MLTGKQEQFAQCIFKGLSHSAAYKEAYDCEHMMDKTIREAACREAKKKNVAARIAELQAQVTAMNKVTVEYIIQKILDEAETAKEPRDRIRALELLGKTKKMFIDRAEIAGEIGVKIVNDIPQDDDRTE